MGDESDKKLQKPSRLPFLFSLLLPGCGQFVQGRVAAGLIFMGAAFLCLVVFGVSVIKIFLNYFRFVSDVNSYEEVPLPKGPMIGAILALLLVYIGGIIDTYIAYIKSCGEWTRERLKENRL